jgi:hypothetical protein
VPKSTGRRIVDSKTYAATLVAFTLLLIVLAKFWLPNGAIFNVSAVEATSNIGVYWDKNCTKSVYSIDWGNLSLGQTKKVLVYVRNEANDSTILFLTTSKWNPANAPNYLSFSWHTQSEKIGAGKVINVTQSLVVSLGTIGISNFSFDITFEGRKYYQGDANKDGVVDLLDIVMVALAFDSKQGSPNWNVNADLDKNGIVDIFDIATVGIDLGKT